MRMFICNSLKNRGWFLFWRWELWEIGGGGGVQWYFLGKEVYPSEKNLLWKIFNIQLRRQKKRKGK